MTEKPDAAIYALALMAQQYLQTDGGELDHLYMSAGEHAIDVLVDHGFVNPHGRGGSWTERGRNLLKLA
ncbi:MAG: hypothetical protein AAGA71_17240 [Pseudomonadota bacterium]